MSIRWYNFNAVMFFVFALVVNDMRYNVLLFVLWLGPLYIATGDLLEALKEESIIRKTQIPSQVCHCAPQTSTCENKTTLVE